MVLASAMPVGWQHSAGYFLMLRSLARFQLQHVQPVGNAAEMRTAPRAIVLPFPWLAQFVDLAADRRSINSGHSNVGDLLVSLVTLAYPPTRIGTLMGDRSIATLGSRVSERKEPGAVATTAPRRVTYALPFADCVAHRDGNPRSGPVRVAGRRK